MARRARPVGRTASGVLALAVGLSLVLPAGAAGKPKWISGQHVNSTVHSCVFGDDRAGVLAEASFRADPRRLPRRGQTFYGRAFIGDAGGGCVTPFAQLQVVLPLGVKLAISRRTPVRCRSFASPTSPIVPLSRTQGCPRRAARGTYGLLLNRTTRQDGLWELPPGEGYYVEFPLRSKRRLKGIESAVPSCPRAADGPPCPRDDAKDNQQVAALVSDGDTNPWVVPHVGLLVRK